MRILGFRKKQPSRQDIFLEKYQSIVGWTKGLTKNDPDLVEDVVQDAYIQFTLNGPPPDEIENLDGYLYTLVKNLCLTSYRRHTRNRLEQLSVFEYDSAEFAISKVDFRDLDNARDQLQMLLHFLLSQKDRKRSASIFILRFIHGYFPSEVSAVLSSSRAAVDVRVLEIRKEIREHFRSRTGFAPVASDEFSRKFFLALPVQGSTDQDEFLHRLRNVVFEFRGGEHITGADLGKYSDGQGPRFKAEGLSHLVSCRECLDRVNEVLGLPGLEERFPGGAVRKKSDSGRSSREGLKESDVGKIVDIGKKS